MSVKDESKRVIIRNVQDSREARKDVVSSSQSTLGTQESECSTCWCVNPHSYSGKSKRLSSVCSRVSRDPSDLEYCVRLLIERRTGGAMETLTMGWVDQAVFVSMLAVSTLIGVYFAYCAPGGNMSAAQYLVGGRTMGTVPVALSLIASYISGITLLGYPAETYVYGMQVAYKMLALPFMGFFVSAQLLPVFRELGGISLYSYFSQRFNSNVRLLASFLFVVGNMCWLPIVIFVPALAYEQVAKVNIHWVTPVVCIVCIYYTTVGGIKAVVWTDAIQAVSMYICVLLVMGVGLFKVGGVGVVWERGVASGRIEPPVLDLDPTTRHTLFTMVLGAFIGHCAHAGLSQSMIQRYLSLSSDRKARTAMWIFILGICVFFLTSCAAGLIIYARYHDCDPVHAKMVAKEDQLLPLFVMETVSKVPGLPGLFISGVFSAALSSMSTSLNSLSAVVLEDWVRGYWGYEPDERHSAWIMRGVVVTGGVITVGLVFIVEKLGMVMQMSASLSAVSTGPLFCLFIVGLFMPWCDTRSALCGAISTALFTAFLVFGSAREIAAGRLRFPRKPVSVDNCLAGFNVTADPVLDVSYDSSEAFPLFRVSYLWYVPLSLLVGLGAAGLAALLGWRSDLRHVEPRLLAPVARRLLPPQPVKAKEHSSAAVAAEQALLLADLRVSLQNLDKNYKEPEKKITLEDCAR
ncbi:Sodium-coupled monocarboxylate transporter 2 [Frankliniella fusca]|uniref:Sodium-coupled monocarboxylate transporter 2 n=1 Tax=Frankliniella fusca TaxID=407009 RepID=A0AAE1HV26_9NEOP|nr:Sodium-coupled monocarboxylate transporter 2 [Frankliniella fusca]